MSKSHPEGFFVTGTDTGIGKTYISRLLADSFSVSRKVTYMKPVQSGCVPDKNGELKAPDFDYVMKGGAKMVGAYDQHVPYRFAHECSPHLASALAGVIISLDQIRTNFMSLSKNKTLTIVEGAGGILSPLSETSFILDLIEHLALPVVLVTSPRLGTINHTSLTLRLLHESGVKIAGIVLNSFQEYPKDYMYHDTLRMIKEHTHPIPFLEVPYGAVCDEKVADFCREIQKQF